MFEAKQQNVQSAPVKKKRSKEKTILSERLKVVNIGISTFADDLRSQDVEVIHVERKPPTGGTSRCCGYLKNWVCSNIVLKSSRLVKGTAVKEIT